MSITHWNRRSCWGDKALDGLEVAARLREKRRVSPACSQLSIAFLIGGLARGFERPVIHLSMMRNMLDSIADGAEREMFVVLKVPPNGERTSKAEEAFGTVSSDPVALSKVLRKVVRPASFTILTNTSMDEEQLRADGLDVPSADLMRRAGSNYLGIFGTLRRLYEMMRLYEAHARDRQPFGTVVFARPDLYYHLPMAPHCAFARAIHAERRLGCGHCHGCPDNLADVFFAASRATFDALDRVVRTAIKSWPPSASETPRVTASAPLVATERLAEAVTGRACAPIDGAAYVIRQRPVRLLEEVVGVGTRLNASEGRRFYWDACAANKPSVEER